MFFNKIRIKRKIKEVNKNNKNNNNNYLNQSSINSQIKSKYNKKDDLIFSRNQKLPTCNSNDNINSVSQKIMSKKIQTIISSNIDKSLENKKNENSLIKEIDNKKEEKQNQNEIKAYTDRKLIKIKINKKIDHPYYSPSVLLKKIKYGLFMNNKKLEKEKQNNISVKSFKNFGFFQFDFDNFNSN